MAIARFKVTQPSWNGPIQSGPVNINSFCALLILLVRPRPTCLSSFSLRLRAGDSRRRFSVEKRVRGRHKERPEHRGIRGGGEK